ncbi:hypothetical protein HDZ31DRAFT_76200 [Schizophyllum fasciatum]
MPCSRASVSPRRPSARVVAAFARRATASTSPPAAAGSLSAPRLGTGTRRGESTSGTAPPRATPPVPPDSAGGFYLHLHTPPSPTTLSCHGRRAAHGDWPWHVSLGYLAAVAGAMLARGGAVRAGGARHMQARAVAGRLFVDVASSRTAVGRPPRAPQDPYPYRRIPCARGLARTKAASPRIVAKAASPRVVAKAASAYRGGGQARG